MTVKELKEEMDEWDDSLPVCIIQENGKVKKVEKVQAYEDDDDELPQRIVLT